MTLEEIISNWEYRRDNEMKRTVELSTELAEKLAELHARGASPEMTLGEIEYFHRQLESGIEKIQKAIHVLGGLNAAKEAQDA